MLFTLIIGAVAGALAQPMQPHVTELLVTVLSEDKLPNSGGRKVVGFALMMMLAAVLLALLDVDGGSVLLLIGGLVGYFQAEIREALINRQS